MDDGSAQLFAALLFRVGFADETFRECGVSHLVEHLALPGGPVPRTDYNGEVDMLTTLLWTRGEPNETCELMSATAERLRDPPRSRFERERRILLAEAETRSWSRWRQAIWLRFGPGRHGLAATRELAPISATDEEITRWSRTRFTAANAVLYMTGKPPKGLRLPLYKGRRRPVPALKPIDYVRYPSVYAHEREGEIAISLIARRSFAMAAALRIAVARLRQQLRHEAGTSYYVDWRYEVLGADRSLVLIWADCQAANVLTTRNRMLGILEELALTGPTDEELERHRENARLAALDASLVPSHLFDAGLDLLLGRPVESFAKSLHEVARVQRADVSAALQEALQTMLLLLPAGTSVPGEPFTEYPVDPPRVPRRGRTFRPTSEGDADPDQVLVVGSQGVALRGPDWCRAVMYDSCVGVRRWDDGTRQLTSEDGFFVTIDPAEWEDGTAAVTAVDKHAPRPLLIDPITQGQAFNDDLQQAIDADDWESQIDLLRAEVERSPDNAEAWGYLSRALGQLNRWGQARHAAERACAIDSLNAWLHTLRARACLHLDLLEDAAAAVKEAVRVDPGDSDTLSDAAWALSNADEDDLAERYAERSVTLHPGDSNSWFARAHVLSGRGKLDEAEPAYRRAVELDPDIGAWHNNLGWLLIRRGKYEEALEPLERAVELDPADIRARSNLALAAGMTGDLSRARALRREIDEEWAEAARHDLAASTPGDNPSRRLAYSLCHLGRHQEALEVARAASHTNDGESVGTYAWVAAAAGEMEEARQALDRLRPITSRGYATYLEEANIAALLGDADTAGGAARVVEDKAPHQVHDALAQGYEAAAAGHWRRAWQSFDRALQSSSRNCCAQTWLGLAHAQLGANAEAADAYQRAEALSTCECLARQRLRAVTS